MPTPTITTLRSGFRYIRQKELLTICPFSAATLWRLVRAQQFVQPVKLGPRITAWDCAQVEAWLQQKGAQK